MIRYLKLKYMKNLWGFFVVCFCACALICLSLPSDQECMNAIRSSAGGGVVATVAINNYTVSVENHIFYKKVYSTLDGQCLGTGFCGHVFVSE